jgi:hypothetical protein
MSKAPNRRIGALCCAYARSGHIAAPDITEMNSRRLISGPLTTV